MRVLGWRCSLRLELEFGFGFLSDSSIPRLRECLEGVETPLCFVVHVGNSRDSILGFAVVSGMWTVL